MDSFDKAWNITKELAYSEDGSNTCPQCKGSGEITIQSSTYGSDEPPKLLPMGCFSCDGTGQMSSEALISRREEMDMWCKCADTDGDAYYVDDFEHPELDKHHWRCNVCDGVVQIG